MEEEPSVQGQYIFMSFPGIVIYVGKYLTTGLSKHLEDNRGEHWVIHVPGRMCEFSAGFTRSRVECHISLLLSSGIVSLFKNR